MNVILVHAVTHGHDHVEDRSTVGRRGIGHVEGRRLGSPGDDPEILEHRAPQILRPDLMREGTLEGHGVLHRVEPGLYRSFGGVDLIDDGVDVVPLFELDLHPVDRGWRSRSAPCSSAIQRRSRSAGAPPKTRSCREGENRGLPSRRSPRRCGRCPRRTARQ